MEKIPIYPEVEHYTHALFFLAELASEIPVVEYSEHLPKIMHIILLGFVHVGAPEVVAQHNCLLFTNIMNLFGFQQWEGSKRTSLWSHTNTYRADKLHKRSHAFGPRKGPDMLSPKELHEMDAFATKVCDVIFNDKGVFAEGRRVWIICGTCIIYVILWCVVMCGCGV